MVLSRRGSGSITLASGQTLAMHHRTHDEEDLPHATKKTMADHLRKYESIFTLTPQRMRMIVEAFKETLELGLTKPEQVVPMIPTFVFGFPNGNEVGDYLAVDLGGTNLRVCLVSVQGEGKFEITQTKYRLTEEQKQDDGQKLFDFCAECLKTFVDSNLAEEESGLKLKPGETLPLGFTHYSSQKRIDHGELIRWTKGFGAPNTEGKDVAEMFRKSLEKYLARIQELPVKLTALINDTTGTLIASHYVNPKTKIACIFGTGCNAAYMEHVKDIPKIKNLGIDEEADMAINCEWGAFDSFEHEHLPRTKYDAIVDDTSNKPGEQAFEKLISGRYLGEILRLVICELIDEGVLFLGQNTYKLENPYVFDTAFLSLMESDPTEELLMIIGIFSHFFAVETTLAERQFFRALAMLIGRRAARLSACGIAAIVSKMNYLEEGCLVGADGSLYNKYPGFADRIHEGLVDIFGEKGRNITTCHAEDGSGVGSAIIAVFCSLKLEPAHQSAACALPPLGYNGSWFDTSPDVMRGLLNSAALYVVLSLSTRFGASAIVEDPADLPSGGFDFIVVGGGTAGNIVANRLSENPKVSVLVIEAGGSHEGIEDLKIPFYCARLTPATRWDWNYTTTPQVALNGRSFPFQRGYVLGGSSSVNTMAYTRGSSDDYDRYANITGDPGWSWNNIQKYIQRFERWTQPADQHNTTGQFDPSAHGYIGVTSVSLSGYPLDTDKRILEATSQLPEEFPYNQDLNAGKPLGVGWCPSTINNGERDSSATSYLSPDVLRRRNLYVLVNSQVTRILVTGTKNGKPDFRNVEFTCSGGCGVRHTLTAKKEVILSAGVVGSPFILLHSGIGNSSELSGVGIKPIVHLPSVGRNLSDHTVSPNLWLVNSTSTLENWVRDPAFAANALSSWRDNRTGPFVDIPITQVGFIRVKDDGNLFAKYGDPSAGLDSPHVELVINNGIAGKTVPPTGNFFNIGVVVVTPFARGSLVLNSSDPLEYPIIDPAYLKSDLDMFLMREGIRSAQRFATAPAIKEYVGQAVYTPGTTDEELNDFIRSNGTNLHHPVGTAAMSSKDADYGVVDPDLRVKGISGVRVIDASVLPFIPSGHTMAATYIFGERGVDLVKSSWGF
ncbi:hypothetical protein DXG01_009678 [Tephrocybe rancida]|nr:hypothetical protein DXG01_009678 [Tephrocybe rancida]